MKYIALGFLILTALGTGYGSYYFTSQTKQILDSGLVATGKVIRIVENVSRDSQGRRSVNYYPVFQYTIDGKSYTRESNTGTNPPQYQLDEIVTLHINPKNHADFIDDSFFGKWGGALILGLFSFITTCLGFGGLYYFINKAKKMKWLKENGTTIKAKIIHVGLNTSVSINGRHPFRVQAEWLNSSDNKIYTFYSENLWHDPAPYLTEQVDVLIDINNPKTHLMVLSKIPQAA